MIDMRELRQLIEQTPANGRAVIIKRNWLEQVEMELKTGAAALAELAAIRAEREATS